MKQPTASTFVKNQESWADHVIGIVRAEIEDREEALRENGWPDQDFNLDEKLMDLYDDELFWVRYGREMKRQRLYLKEKYFNE
jgi:hypothetical protein